MLIVIALVMILTLIVIPRVIGATRKTKESSLRADLRRMRNAIEAFQGDCAAWPPSLADLVAPNSSSLSGASDGNGVALDPASYQGPYLVTPDGSLPKDPITTAADWSYDNSTGALHSSSTVTASDGTFYNQW
jgi:type II secretory pathway pseudopilin PulG